ncbi:hypothetical protein EOD00_20300, partial [Mesorhizobium sp. M7A.T.Ca.TU.009.01.3.1]
MTELTLKAKHDHLAKVASTRDYVKALAEFVWNALDADADEVAVEFSRNALDGLDSILIRDNGSGISKTRAEHDFESLGDSWKLQASRTALNSRVIHGKEGQGRLKFYSLARKANWVSVYEEEGSLLTLSIAIDADSLHKSSVSEPAKSENGAARGTILELAPLKDTFDWLTSEEARSEFDAIFAPYILQYPGVSIVYDGRLVDPNATIERAYEFDRSIIVCPGRVVKDLSLRVIEWKSKAGSRKIYFGGETGVVLGSQSANVTAPGFDFSVYAYSPFFQ